MMLGLFGMLGALMVLVWDVPAFLLLAGWSYLRGRSWWGLLLIGASFGWYFLSKRVLCPCGPTLRNDTGLYLDIAFGWCVILGVLMVKRFGSNGLGAPPAREVFA